MNYKSKIKLIIVLALILSTLLLSLSFLLQDKSSYLKNKYPNISISYQFYKTKPDKKHYLTPFFHTKNIYTFYKIKDNNIPIMVYTNNKGENIDNGVRVGFLKRLEDEIGDCIPLDKKDFKIDFSASSYTGNLDKPITSETDFSGIMYRDYLDFKAHSILNVAVTLYGKADDKKINEINKVIEERVKTIGIYDLTLTVTYNSGFGKDYYKETINFKR